MARNVLVDAGFLVALLSRRDSHHQWAVTQAPGHAPPWRTCEAVLSEAIHLLGARGAPGLGGLLRRRALIAAFNLDNDVESVLKLLQKEDIVPQNADRALFNLAPPLGAIAALGAAAVVPFSPAVIAADLDVGVLYILAIGALTVLPVMVPVSVPCLFMWHEEHEPSAGSTASARSSRRQASRS